MSEQRVSSDYPQTAGAGGFLDDFRSAMAAAHEAGDVPGANALSDLWLKKVEREIVGMSEKEFVAFLRKQRVWRTEGVRPVYRLGSEPTLAYTPVRYLSGELEIILLGTCYRLPSGGDPIWWSSTIQPRLKGL